MLTQRRLISIASGLQHGEALANGLSELSLANVNDAVDSLVMALAAWRITEQFAPEDGWSDQPDEETEYEPYDAASWGLG